MQISISLSLSNPVQPPVEEIVELIPLWELENYISINYPFVELTPIQKKEIRYFLSNKE